MYLFCDVTLSGLVRISKTRYRWKALSLLTLLGLSTSCWRFSKTFPVISQKVAVCLPTDYLPTIKAFFHFSYVLKLKLSCSCAKWNTTPVKFLFLLFKPELFIWFFVEKVSQKDSSMAAFLTVHTGCYGGLQEKYFNISNFNYLCSSFIILLLEAGLFIWFLGWGKLRHGIQRMWKLSMQAFTAEYRKSFWTHLLAFQELHPRWACVIFTVSVLF